MSKSAENCPFNKRVSDFPPNLDFRHPQGPSTRKPNKHVWVSPKLHSVTNCEVGFAPLFHTSYTRDRKSAPLCTESSKFSFSMLISQVTSLMLISLFSPPISSFFTYLPWAVKWLQSLEHLKDPYYCKKKRYESIAFIYIMHCVKFTFIDWPMHRTEYN
jgi:hypothetical protein